MSRFPTINHINDVLPHIAGRDEFVVKHDKVNGYKVINYNMALADTFLDPFAVGISQAEKLKRQMILECRGITFCDKTGRVLNRKFHKFKNLNESFETREENVDFTKPHVLLEKLDGSMLTFILINDEVKACTKMGTTDIAKQVDVFIKNNPIYALWIRVNLLRGVTPIFEWCSRQQRIVVDHPVDRLVLLAVRDNVTGEYMRYSEMLLITDVEVVQPHSGEIVDGEEGYIVRFDDGHMLKVKGSWYVQLHKTLDGLRHEKDVIRMILDERLDDAKGFIPVDLATACDAFGAQIYKNIRTAAGDIYWEAQAAFDKFNGSKKRFALEVANGHKFSPFLFKMYDNLDEGENYMYKYLIDHVRMNTSSQTKVNGVRHIIGDKTWNDYVTLGEKDE